MIESDQRIMHAVTDKGLGPTKIEISLSCKYLWNFGSSRTSGFATLRNRDCGVRIGFSFCAAALRGQIEISLSSKLLM